MPRKPLDPINDVINYFETVPLDSARTALEVAGAIVRRRAGVKAPAAPQATASGKKQVAAGRTPRAAAPINQEGPGPVSQVGS
jgi:hypothetical protein